MRKQFEYKEVFIHQGTTYVERLNKEGDDGWQLVDKVEGGRGWNLTFMREVDE